MTARSLQARRRIAFAYACVVACLATTATGARAEPVSIWDDANGQGGYSLSASIDAGADRVAGGRATVFGDILGIGFAVLVDVITSHEVVEDVEFTRTGAAVGAALRVSPVTMLAAGRRPEVLRWFDAFAVAGFGGGLNGSIGGATWRGSTFVGIGGELRIGAVPGRGVPGIRVEYQIHGNRSPGFTPRELVFVGLTWTSVMTVRD